MRDTDLFGMALAIASPWVVRRSDFDAAALSLLSRDDMHETFAKGIVSNDADHDRRLRIDKSVFRPFHEFREVE